MTTKSDTKLTARAAELRYSRKKLKAKNTAIRRAIREQTNAAIVKFVRNSLQSGQCDEAEITAELTKILSNEQSSIDQTKIPRKTK